MSCRIFDRLIVLSLFLSLAACASDGKAPQQFAEGVGWMARHHQVSDARTQRVTGWPCLRVDPVLIDQINQILAERETDRAKSMAHSFVDGAHGLSLSVGEAELERLDENGWRELMKIYFNGIELEPTPHIKRLLLDEFRRRTDLQAWFLQEKITSAPDIAALRSVLVPIRDQIEPSVKQADRGGQRAALAIFALPAVMARDAIHAQESTCQIDEKFEGAIHFVCAGEQPRPQRQSDVEHWDLLVKYAPVFVQEHPSTTAYDRAADRIGRVGVLDDRRVTIDGAEPTVYGYTRVVRIAGQPHIQLTYSTWYAERPKIKSPIDAEAGRIDGATLRITLDASFKPAVFETLNNCGCHHRLYPSAALEAAAASQYGPPLPGKVFAIERDVEGKYDLIIPKTLTIDSDAASTFVRCRAGTHALVDVAVNDDDHKDEPVIDRRPYRLLPYDELERLVSPSGRTVSMFEPNGLVRGAERMEGTLFNPLGMLSAGQPRQRGTQLIHWDQFDFDHPMLLESTLRMPSKF